MDKVWLGINLDLINIRAAVFSMDLVWKMNLLAAIYKSNEAQTFMAVSILSDEHLHQVSWYLDLYIGSYDQIIQRYRICQKSDKVRIYWKSLALKGPQVGIIFISGLGTYVWYWVELRRWRSWSLLDVMFNWYSNCWSRPSNEKKEKN